MKKFLGRYKYLISTIILVLVVLGFVYVKDTLKKSNKTVKLDSTLAVSKEEEPTAEEEHYYVDIKGAVTTPGVYEVTPNNRVIDVVNLAGGVASNANTSLINLSKKVTDEMVIIIYTNEEVLNSNVINTVFKEIDKECNCPNIKNDSCINTDLPNKNTSTSGNTSNGKVNINTASMEELQELNGIGESKAKAIIAYRDENGEFNAIEDLLKVSGVGQSIYDKIKENITV